MSLMKTRPRFPPLVSSCYACDWVVDIRDPIEQPEYVLEYLARYTHRIAISNNRILSLEEGKVTFTYKNRDTGQTVQTTIDAVEFIRRFLKGRLSCRGIQQRAVSQGNEP
jgi:hypothetical protein